VEKPANDADEMILSPKRHRRFGLPWFFVFIGWGLCIATICVSIFFIWAYAVSFGNDITYKWLSSTIFSFFAAVLIIEPLKVFHFLILHYVVEKPRMKCSALNKSLEC
jgi:hypothetical protein